MKVNLLYGSETGTCFYEAQTFAMELKKVANLKVNFVTMNDYKFENIIKDNYLLIMVSTTGQGEFPRNARQFWDKLLINFPSNILKNQNYTIFGFGDSSYANYNIPSLVLDFRLKQLGANNFVPIKLGDDNKNTGYFEDLQIWKSEIFKNLFQIKISDFSFGRGNFCELEIFKNKFEKKNDNYFNFIEYLQEKQYITGEVIETKLLTAEDHFQEIYSLKIVLPKNIQYLPGDLINIYYTNPIETIKHYIELMDFDLFLLKEKSEFEDLFDLNLDKRIISSEQLLSEVLDIQKPPNFHMVKSLQNLAEGVYKERLVDMNFEDYYDYVIKEKRELFEIAYDFQIKKIPLEMILNNYPFIRPRQYSLASSFKKTKNEVEIVYNVVEYKTRYKRDKKGLCTNYMKNLKIGDKIGLKIEKGLFEYNKFDCPYLMIATGTGIAPFLSLINELEIINKINSKKHVLLYGCRFQNKDFIYKDYLLKLQSEEKLKTFFSFSREEKDKKYVQHILENEKEFFIDFIKKYFENINILVCGNSKFLALSVEKALKIILLFILPDEQKVELTIKKWKKEKRLCYELYS